MNRYINETYRGSVLSGEKTFPSGAWSFVYYRPERWKENIRMTYFFYTKREALRNFKQLVTETLRQP